MRVLSVVHQHDAGPGVFADAGAELVQWVPAEAAPPDPAGFDAAMVFGGSMNVDEEDAHAWLGDEKHLIRSLLERRTPILGVCLGSQLLAEAAGADPRRAARPEIGWHAVELTDEGRDDPLLSALPERFEAFQWHSYEAPLPPGAVPLARSPVCLQAYRLAGAAAWGIQFHAEVDEGIVRSWLADYRADADAVRIGIDPAALARETAAKIGAWNELGRRFARRFLAEAGARGAERG
jgi:GMP synthase (glutamine-hydrolysing)